MRKPQKQFFLQAATKPLKLKSLTRGSCPSSNLMKFLGETGTKSTNSMKEVLLSHTIRLSDVRHLLGVRHGPRYLLWFDEPWFGFRFRICI